MNRAEIHEQISDISERILKLNQNLIEARRILPVELDLLKSYQAELGRLMQVLANADRAAGITTNTQGEVVTETAPRAEKEAQQAVEIPAPEPEELAFDVPVEETETGAEPRVPLHVEDDAAETEPVQEQQEPEPPELKTEAFEFDVQQEETGAEPRVEIQVEEPEQEPEPEPEIVEQEVEEVVEPETVTETTAEEEPVAEKEEVEEVELPEEPINVAHAKPEEVTVETDKTDKPQELTTDDYEDEEDERETKGSAEEERKLSINDRFKQQEPDLGYRVRPHAGTRNLRDMIDLSEKYVYARELFGGDTDFFERTLHYLNKCNSYSEAQNYINSELKGKYNWEQKQPIEQRFTKLLKAKFEN